MVIGPDGPDEFLNRRLVEDGYEVDAPESGDELRTFVFRIEWPAITF
jgi:hypothetical protein